MKTIVPFLTILLLGCTVSKVPSYTVSYALDFRKYTDAGFLITTEALQGKYEAIGIVEATHHPGAAYLEQAPDVLPPNYELQGNWMVEMPNPYKALDSLYSKAVRMGADAVMNFKVSTDQQRPAGTETLNLTVLTVSGFAVRRN